ncbi:MAG: thiamine phosphate synthase [Rhodothermaceae bacterium]
MENFHLITQEIADQTSIQLTKKFLSAGGKWVQLRMKNTPEETILETALEIKKLCEKCNASLIINDNPEIAKKVNADGVHLGKNDISPSEARKILGGNFIIGGTANTISDIKYLVDEGVDYIGLGPFRFTTTKKNLSPVLGIEGYTNIISEMKKNNITLPVVAIGGIEMEDISVLMKTGINGIAVSSLIAKNESPENITEKIINELK